MGQDPPHPPLPSQSSGLFSGFVISVEGGEKGIGWEVANSEKGMSSEAKYGLQLLNICGSNPEQ